MKLCEVGDIDYLTWEKTFRNNKSGRGREELLLDINDTCAVMENALEKWMDKIEENRKDCYSLNLFTMKQILKLRKELASACTGLLAVDELPLQVYTLLESVCRDVQPFILDSILLSVVPETEYSGYLTEKTRSGDMSFYMNDEQDKLDEPNEPDAKMVGPTAQFHPAAVALRNPTEVFNCAREKLEESGYSDEVVVAALKAKGSNATVDELVVWSIKNVADKEAIDRLYEEALLDPTLASLLKDYTDADVDENSSSGSELDGLANRDEK